MKRIGWKSNRTNATGQGTGIFEEEEAKLIIKILNAEHPDIHHYLIEAE